MFRLFLQRKIAEGVPEPEPVSPPTGRSRNRRISERYKVDFKHLTLLNEQDILLVREISSRGFSTHVAKSSLERFSIGDVYLARLRYFGEVYEIEAKVTWKGNDSLGFEIREHSEALVLFMQRLLRPIAIANSMRLVDASFASKNDDEQWYHGEDETDLFLWRHENGNLSGWRLVSGSDFLSWNEELGLSMGVMERDIQGDAIIREEQRIAGLDSSANKVRVQFAMDIIMALDEPIKDEIVPTLQGGDE